MAQNRPSSNKSTRAFRTISEAADELDLQSHVLRFWESKFSDIQPMKRRGGRRFYRPEDIEFLRGIKVLLHREKHPIKDVQKLIRIRGPQSVRDLGRSVEQASKPRDVKDTNLVPKRIKPVAGKPVVISARSKPVPKPVPEPVPGPVAVPEQERDIVRRPGYDTPKTVKPEPIKPEPIKPEPVKAVAPPVSAPTAPAPQEAQPSVNSDNKENLEDALSRLKNLKSRWQKFT